MQQADIALLVIEQSLTRSFAGTGAQCAWPNAPHLPSLGLASQVIFPKLAMRAIGHLADLEGIALQPDKKHVRRISEPRLFATQYRSPQLALWEPGAVVWQLPGS